MGQHKYNPTAIAAREGKLPPKPDKISAAESRRRIMAALRIMTGAEMLSTLARRKTLPEPPRKIKTWEELEGLVSSDGRYKIEVDLEYGNGQIVPTFEVPDSEYYDHHEYLSTHAFYEKTHRMYTEILQRFGFNVELVSWGD